MAGNYRISVVNCCTGPGSRLGAGRWSGSRGRARLSRRSVCHGNVGMAPLLRALPTEPPGRLTSWNQSRRPAPWPPLSTESPQSHAPSAETRRPGTAPSPWWPLPALCSAGLCWSGPLRAEVRGHGPPVPALLTGRHRRRPTHSAGRARARGLLALWEGTVKHGQRREGPRDPQGCSHHPATSAEACLRGRGPQPHTQAPRHIFRTEKEALHLPTHGPRPRETLAVPAARGGLSLPGGQARRGPSSLGLAF